MDDDPKRVFSADDIDEHEWDEEQADEFASRLDLESYGWFDAEGVATLAVEERGGDVTVSLEVDYEKQALVARRNAAMVVGNLLKRSEITFRDGIFVLEGWSDGGCLRFKLSSAFDDLEVYEDDESLDALEKHILAFKDLIDAERARRRLLTQPPNNASHT